MNFSFDQALNIIIVVELSIRISNLPEQCSKYFVRLNLVVHLFDFPVISLLFCFLISQ